MADYVKFLREGRRIVENANYADGKARDLLLKAVSHFRSWQHGADFGSMNKTAEIMLRKGFVDDAINIFDETGNDVGLEELLKKDDKMREKFNWPYLTDKQRESILLILKTRPYAEFTNYKPEPE